MVRKLNWTFLLLCITTGLFFNSCDNDDPKDEEVTKAKVPTKITFLTEQEDGYISFQYDSQNRFKSMVANDLEEEDVYTFTYTSDGKLDKIMDNDEGTVITSTFTYENGKITQYVTGGEGDPYHIIYTVNSNGQITSWKYEDETDDEAVKCTYDSKGNISKFYYTDSYDQKEMGYEYQQYDSNPGIFSQVKSSPVTFFAIGQLESFGIEFLINNVLKEKNIDNNETLSYTYEYDGDGYPVRIKSGEEDIISIEYKTIN